MQAIVCEEPHKLSLGTRPAPIPKAGEVLIRIRRVGLCGTDYHIFAGKHPYLEYPRVMGHELAGLVEVPSGATLKAGQMVTVNPYLACGTCIACRKGKPNCCAAIKVLGVHTDGGMCELLSVPEAAIVDASGLSLEQAAMVEFLAIGAHAIGRAKLSPGARVLVVGAGPIGVAAALFARLDGAEVTIVDVRSSRLQYARDRLGLDPVMGPTETVSAELAARTAGEMFDCVFDATGNVHAMRSGLDYVAHGGTYVLLSVVKEEIAFSDPEFHKRETTLLASRNALSADFERVVGAIKTGKIPTDALLTHSFPALEAPRRIPELIAGASGILKAMVEF
ncbi:MAG TPA: zinc-binding alcohol dehydrogenase family protein [Steroidobacteraceae bacterium]|jgi:2-desacetyl-2-hydroxyethyl bacteriochlorophyllide A dehydrogenase